MGKRYLLVVIGGGGLSRGEGGEEPGEILGADGLGFFPGNGFHAEALDGFNTLLEIEIGGGFQRRNLREAVLINDTLHSVRKLAAEA